MLNLEESLTLVSEMQIACGFVGRFAVNHANYRNIFEKINNEM